MYARVIPCALAAVCIGVAGCAGNAATLRAENRVLQARVAELQEERRDETRRARDLENEVFLLRDKLETAKVARQRATDSALPTLPVEVVEPDEEPAATTAAADDDWEVVGVDHDGNEIVYVGDAAKDHSVRPRLELYGEGGTRTDSRNERPPRRDPPAPAPTPVGDGLGVTSDVPTIDAQLADARRRRAAAEESDDDGPRAEYKRYYAALRAGNHAYAITGFGNFIERYPRHGYADNAQYWLGEAYYDKKDYQRALAAFRKVVERYPNGNKVPDALLKIGYCYAALGKASEARSVLQQLVDIYPKSGPAGLAARRLEELAD